MAEHGMIRLDAEKVRRKLRSNLQNSVPPEELPQVVEETLYRFMSAVHDIAQHLRSPHRLELEIPAYRAGNVTITMIMPVVIAPAHQNKETEDG